MTLKDPTGLLSVFDIALTEIKGSSPTDLVRPSTHR